MLNEVKRLTQGKTDTKSKTVVLNEDEALHIVDVLELHAKSLESSEYRMFSEAQKENIRAFDGAIIEKLRCE